jgi:hypothetical protein
MLKPALNQCADCLRQPDLLPLGPGGNPIMQVRVNAESDEPMPRFRAASLFLFNTYCFSHDYVFNIKAGPLADPRLVLCFVKRKLSMIRGKVEGKAAVSLVIGSDRVTRRVKIELDELTEDEAWALAQLCKRLTWDEFRKLSANRCEHEDMDRATINSAAHSLKLVLIHVKGESPAGESECRSPARIARRQQYCRQSRHIVLPIRAFGSRENNLLLHQLEDRGEALARVAAFRMLM